MAVIKRNTVTERKNAFDGLISRLDTVSTFSPSIFHEVMGPDAMIVVF